MQKAAVAAREAFFKLICCTIEAGKAGGRGQKHTKAQPGLGTRDSSVESGDGETPQATKTPARAETAGKNNLNVNVPATPEALERWLNRANIHVCKHPISYWALGEFKLFDASVH